MRLELGPVDVPEIPDELYMLEPSTLAGDAWGHTIEEEQIEIDVWQQLLGFGPLLDYDPDADLAPPLLEAGPELETLSFLIGTDLPPDLATNADQGDQLIMDAENATPPEATTVEQAPYQPPPELPEPPPQEIEPVAPPVYVPPVIPPYVPPVLPLSQKLENLTTGLDTIFHPGENFRLTITGPPGQIVSVQTWLNNSRLADVNYGITGADGVWSITGFFSNGDVGAWVEQWFVGGVTINPPLFFVCV